MRPEDLITYGYLVRKTMGEYCNIVASNWWEPTDIKEKSQDENFPLNFSTGAIEYPVIKTKNKYNLKIRHSGKDNDSGGD